MNHIRLYDILRRELHLSDDKAGETVFAMQEMAEIAIVSKIDLLATKEDIYSLRHELSTRISGEINSVRREIQDSKENIYRAIFLSGVVQFIAMIASLLAIIKWMK